jgi:hypothetical protein
VRIAQGCVGSGRRGAAVLAIGCLVAFVAKIVFELLTGSAFFVHDASGMVPVPLAHVMGATVGALVGCVKKVPSRADFIAEVTS